MSRCQVVSVCWVSVVSVLWQAIENKEVLVRFVEKVSVLGVGGVGVS